MELKVGQSFGDYEILGTLGAGGMGKVYKVRNKISNRVEAMKILLSGLTFEPELVDRFTREIRIFGSLNHPNIAELRTALKIEDQLVMIMEFVEGQALDAIAKQGRIPVAQLLDYMSQALAALSYAHSKGVVHRDIKPANMMLTPEGDLKLMDFGIAKAATDPKLTRTGFVVGSVYYIPPEQIEGKELDGRSDLYSLGVTMYELATGKRPFEGASDYQIISSHLKDSPPAPRDVDPTLPAELNDIILLALAKDPDQRFQTADAFRNAICSIAGFDLPVRQQRMSTASRQAITAQPPLPPRAQTATPAGRPAASPPLPPITPPPAVAAKQNTRLLYMLAGSVATIAVIVGAVIEIPKIMRTSAAGQPGGGQIVTPTPVVKPPTASPVPSQPAQPVATEPAVVTQPVPSPQPTTAPQVAATVPAVKPEVTKPVARPPVRPQVQAPTIQVAPTPVQHASVPNAAQVTPPNAAAVVLPAPAQPAQAGNTAAVAELRERANLMSIRIVTARISFQNLQKQQAASGLSPRADMMAADQRLGYQMDQAEASLQQGDVAGAKRRMDSAERDLERLESFLGK